MLNLKRGRKAQVTKDGSAKPAQGKGTSTRDWKDEVPVVRKRIWHRAVFLFVDWVLSWGVRRGILAWVKNWTVTLYHWYSPMTEEALERFEELARAAREFCPDIKAERLYNFYRLRCLPSSEAETQAIMAAGNPQGYWDFFRKHPEEKRLYSPSCYVEFKIPHRR